MKNILRYGTVIMTQLALTQVLYAQELLKGKVVDDKSQPISGVTIHVNGKGSGTTNQNGEFGIIAKSGDKITFTSIEYLAKSLNVVNLSFLQVNLVRKQESLDEVVVIGYGTQKQKNLTAPVSKFKAENLDERPIARVDQALIGQIAGVRVKQSTGVPGKGLSVQVRGSGSISAGTEPLYVVDGFPLQNAKTNTSGGYSSGNPLDNMNPNDIESVEVLKDAAAAAIYGSRAGNGVVLITTKRGRTGEAKLSLNSYVGISSPYRKLDMLNGEEWIDRQIEMINAQWVASGKDRLASQSNEERRKILGLADGTYNTSYMYDDRWLEPGHPGLYMIDWQDEAYRKGITQNYQVTGSGGTEYINYYVSGNYMNQQGIVHGLNYKNYTARANVELKANKKLSFGLNLAPSYSIGNDPGVEGKDNIMHQIYSMSPVQDNPAGTVNVLENDKYPWSTSTNDPIAKLRNYLGENKISRLLGTIYGQYHILDHLTFKTTVNLDQTDSRSNRFEPYTIAGSLANRLTNPNQATYGSNSVYRRQTFVNENTLNYTVTIGKHDLTALVGQAYNFDKLETTSITSKDGYINSSIKTLNGAVATVASTGATQSILLSYFGRVQYAFDGKYLFSASLRRDGSSRFGNNTKWGLFPSLSFGWRVSDENFMKSLSFINDLKLRGSFGTAGNNNIGDYSSISVLGIYNYSANGNSASGQAPKNIINPDLKWEKSRTYDVGLDFGLIGSRITGSFDWYTRKSSDLLLNVPSMYVTGFGSYLDNAGELKSNGWDLEVTSHNIKKSDFTWSTSFNISHSANRVTKLEGDQREILIPSSFDIQHSLLRVGEPMYSIYVVQQNGILSQQDIDNGAALFGNEKAGDPRYVDANGDGVIDANDRVIVGHPNPDYVWGITNNFKYKNFDLSFMFQGQNGGHIYSLLGRALGRTGQGASDNALGFYRDRWRSAEDPGDGRVGKAYSTFGRIKNTDWLYSSDYWRLRNITLGYNIKDMKLGSQSKLSMVRLFMTLENFWGKDKYDGGVNPESSNTNLSGSDTYPEAGDYGGLAIPKTITFGLNVNF
ncbi:TonB-dependent receptor [Sphingobacterium sp.]|uniref:SusC/RagA family TonB-linked outer membrane protein n=1 Tax=Sphingobacterium sp. TaxID=341027 RepID=UPI0031D2085B